MSLRISPVSGGRGGEQKKRIRGGEGEDGGRKEEVLRRRGMRIDRRRMTKAGTAGQAGEAARESLHDRLRQSEGNHSPS